MNYGMKAEKMAELLKIASGEEYAWWRRESGDWAVREVLKNLWNNDKKGVGVLERATGLPTPYLRPSTHLRRSVHPRLLKCFDYIVKLL